MKNKKTYYIISALLWLLIGFISYQFYSFQKHEEKTEQPLVDSVNDIHLLYNLGFDKVEIWRRKQYRREIIIEYTHQRGRMLLDTISMVKAVVDSLETEKTIKFSNIKTYYNKDYYYENYDIDYLNLFIENEEFYNQSEFYGLLYKNTLLKTLRKGNYDRYNKIGGMCGFYGLQKLHLFEKNKIGLALDKGYFDIFYSNYPKTKSTNFEFETVVEKLDRNHQIIRTRYKTIPQKDKELGRYDYEKIETIIEK